MPARSFGWAPTDDTAQLSGPSAASVHRSGRSWTATGLAWSGHLVAVNPATGAVSVTAVDRSAPFHATTLNATRTYSAQEQYAQTEFLRRYPNTDPRPHFLGNWALDQEAAVSEAWHSTRAEVLLESGGTGSTLAYRDEPRSADVAGRLDALGVPLEARRRLDWTLEPGDRLLRNRQGTLSIVGGRILAETLVDPCLAELWRFFPITGVGEHYTSRYAYQRLVGADGVRETNVPVVRRISTDATGHAITFEPASARPPHHAWFLTDGSGRRYRFELATAVEFLDGDNPGGRAKYHVVSQLVDGDWSVEYGYDGLGRLADVTFPGHRIYRYAYDDRGALVRIEDPVGDTLSFEYVEDDLDADDRLLARLKVVRIRDGNGNEFRYAYDQRLTRVTALGELQLAYTEDTDDTGQRFVTDQSIRVTQGPSAPQVITTTTVYSADGRFLPVRTIDPLGHASTMEYNEYNQLTALVDALGQRREYTYDLGRHDLVRIVEAGPVVRRFEYDDAHRLTASTDPLGHVTRYAYDGDSLAATRSTDPLGYTTTRVYDDRGAMVSTTDAVGGTIQSAYGPRGELLSVEDPNGNIRRWSYDPVTGWLATVTDALGAAVTYMWNAAGRCTAVEDAVGARTEYAYDPSTRLRSITQYDPAQRVTLFAYDSVGNLLRLTDPGGRRITVRYDESNRPYDVSTGGPTSLRYIRDPAGRVVAATSYDGSTTSLEYDALGRLVTMQEPSWPSGAPANPGKRLRLAYDPQGRRVRVDDSEAGGATRYTYDAAGNLLSRVDPDGYELHYSYDARNVLVRVHDTLSAVDLTFTVDGAARPTQVTDSAYLDQAETFGYRYSSGPLVDNLYGIDLPAGLATDITYDANRRPTTVRHARAGATLAAFAYAYWPDGLIRPYDYDGRKQLVMPDGYDASGNRLPGLYDAQNRLTTDGYDGNGNLVTHDAVTYTYDGANRLRTVDDGTTTVHYGYDADSRMVSRTNGPDITIFKYANQSIVAELDAASTPRALYTRDPSGRLLRYRSQMGARSLYYLLDGLGSVARLVDHQGQTHLEADYDEWGAARSTATLGGFRYRSGYQDVVTGLLNFGARWYAPTLARWLSPDPLLSILTATNADIVPSSPALSNLYRYALNNPSNVWDPTGLEGTDAGSTGSYLSSLTPDYWNLTFGLGFPWGLGVTVSVEGSMRGPGLFLSEGGGLAASLCRPARWWWTSTHRARHRPRPVYGGPDPKWHDATDAAKGSTNDD
ncbi:RHS repeat-associated core domain-containing protein [Streptomyces prunicolor]|uniref:RHS repeat-associated core domain-containing protein n=1 Tax=Streptomyces prunicolor TaxID=67348 RepID=UPI0033FFBD23